MALQRIERDIRRAGDAADRDRDVALRVTGRERERGHIERLRIPSGVVVDPNRSTAAGI